MARQGRRTLKTPAKPTAPSPTSGISGVMAEAFRSIAATGSGMPDGTAPDTTTKTTVRQRKDPRDTGKAATRRRRRSRAVSSRGHPPKAVSGRRSAAGAALNRNARPGTGDPNLLSPKMRTAFEAGAASTVASQSAGIQGAGIPHIPGTFVDPKDGVIRNARGIAVNRTTVNRALKKQASRLERGARPTITEGGKERTRRPMTTREMAVFDARGPEGLEALAAESEESRKQIKAHLESSFDKRLSDLPQDIVTRTAQEKFRSEVDTARRSDRSIAEALLKTQQGRETMGQAGAMLQVPGRAAGGVSRVGTGRDRFVLDRDMRLPHGRLLDVEARGPSQDAQRPILRATSSQMSPDELRGELDYVTRAARDLQTGVSPLGRPAPQLGGRLGPPATAAADLQRAGTIRSALEQGKTPFEVSEAERAAEADVTLAEREFEWKKREARLDREAKPDKTLDERRFEWKVEEARLDRAAKPDKTLAVRKFEQKVEEDRLDRADREAEGLLEDKRTQAQIGKIYAETNEIIANTNAGTPGQAGIDRRKAISQRVGIHETTVRSLSSRIKAVNESLDKIGGYGVPLYERFLEDPEGTARLLRSRANLMSQFRVSELNLEMLDAMASGDPNAIEVFIGRNAADILKAGLGGDEETAIKVLAWRDSLTKGTLPVDFPLNVFPFGESVETQIAALKSQSASRAAR